MGRKFTQKPFAHHGKKPVDIIVDNDIGTPLNRSASLPDYRVQIHIEQFEQESNNRVKLVARWQFSGGPQSGPSVVFSAELQNQETIKKKNYEQMVSVMRKLYGELSKRIAETIIAQDK